MYLNNYKGKIISGYDLKKKNIKNLALCHGVFDIVHPGHLRHFYYVKKKSSNLVVSITSDRFIKKGNYRPFVNEKLRALNLALIELVDYVIIDDNPTPLKLIKLIKPNIFAKGGEYSNFKNPKSVQESNLVKSYGGEVIFTPGDIVFSSTKIIESNKVNYDLDKIRVLMDNNNINFSKLKSIINKFKKIKVVVFGDSIIDQIIECTNSITQNKTPTLSLNYQNSKSFAGGASIVAMHLKAAGAIVNFFSILGIDRNGSFIINQMKKANIKSNFLIKRTFTTNLKKVFRVDKYNILKVSSTNSLILNELELKKIISNINKINPDILIISDFRHGIFNKNNISFLNKNLIKKITKVADSQVASRWGNICDFKGFDLITPNEKEARFSTGDQDSNISMLARKIINKSKCKNLILKLGKNGSLSVKKFRNKYEAYTLPAISSNEIDAVGTGDALLAYSSLAFKISKCVATAHLIGSIAASCKVEQLGNQPIKINDIMKKVNDLEKLIL